VLVALCYLVCALVWGTTWFAIRVCIGPDGFPTYAAAAIRFTLAAAFLLLLVRFGLGRPRPRTRRQFLALSLAGVFNAMAYACVYRAEENLPGGLMAVLFGTYPLFTALAAAATGTERVRRVDVGAALLSLGGMVILFWDRLSVSPDQAIAVVFAIGAVLATVAYNLVFKREAGGIHPLSSTAVFLSVASLALWPAALLESSQPVPLPLPLAPTVAILYLALFGSVLTFCCYFYMLERVSLMTSSTLALVQPITALVVDALWEDEVRLAARSYVGVALTIAGVAVGLSWKWWLFRRAAADPSPPASRTAGG
jgi:drug/metabolite transporter (DMT)-like permease